MEKEMTGLYLTGHPLEDYEELIKNKTSTRTIDILGGEALEEDVLDEASKHVDEENARIKDGDRVIIGGLITEASRKITKNNTMMAFIKLEDLYSSIEVIVFPKILSSFGTLIQEDEIVLVKGRVTKREDEQPKVICDAVEKLIKASNKKLYIQVNGNEEVKKAIEDLRTISAANQGNVPIYLCTKNEKKKYLLSREYWVKENENIINFLNEKYGKENIKII
jgi:DNA polymerase-3 subunit alpha